MYTKIIIIFTILLSASCAELDTEGHSLGMSAYQKMHHFYEITAGKELSDRDVQLLLAPENGTPRNWNMGVYGYGGNWCTEAYVKALANAGYKDSQYITSHVQLKKFFKNKNAIIDIDDASIGDFLQLDTNNNGIPNHTAMFVARQHETGLFITLEGNVVKSTFDYMIRDVSQITAVGCVNCLAESTK
jgi:hypothetical protein